MCTEYVPGAWEAGGARTGSALNCRAISPGPHVYICERMNAARVEMGITWVPLHFIYRSHKSQSMCGHGTVELGNRGSYCSFRSCGTGKSQTVDKLISDPSSLLLIIIIVRNWR